MKLNFINSWASGSKQDDKLMIVVRLGKLTLIEISSDISSKFLRLIVFNVGIEITK